MPRISKIEKRAAATNVTSGLGSSLMKRMRYLIGGKTYSRRELVAVFRAHIDAIDDVDRARATLADKVRKEKEASKQAKAIARMLKLKILGHFGASPTALGAFGWSVPKKPGPKTIAAKAAGVNKRTAARERRAAARG